MNTATVQQVRGAFIIILVASALASSGCIEPPIPVSFDGWRLAETASYDVIGVLLPEPLHWTYEAALVGDAGLDVTVAGSRSTAHLDADTGYTKSIEFEDPGYTAAPSWYWPIMEDQVMPEARYIIGSNPAPVENHPVSLAYLAASIGDNVAVHQLGPVITFNATGWRLQVATECHWACTSIDGYATTQITATLAGNLGELWPTQATYTATSATAEGGYELTLTRTNVSAKKLVVNPTLGSTDSWVLDGKYEGCLRSPCQGDDAVPARFDNRAILQAVETSPTFMDWDATHQSDFIRTAVLGIQYPDDRLAGVAPWNHVINYMGKDMEVATFSAETLQIDPTHSIAVVTQSDGAPIEGGLYPTNPYEGKWHSWSEILTQAQTDGIDFNTLDRVSYFAQSTKQFPTEHYRVSVSFTIKHDGVLEWYSYSLATGQRVQHLFINA